LSHKNDLGMAGDSPVARTGRSRGLALTLVVILTLVAVCVAVVGIFQRKRAHAELETYTNATAAPTVSLMTPKRGASASEIVLPGNIQAHTVAPIYARTTGYVKSWSHDIGSHVRKGDLLAVIETPELDQQLAQSKAELVSAQSNAALAKVTADRYQGLLKQNAVSQQDTDNAVAELRAREAAVTSAEANVKRLEQMVSFERVVAPFDGVVTARNLDVGQLVGTAGSTTTAGAGTITGNKPMFEISDLRTLRVYINVPQINAPDAKAGVVAALTLPQYPGKTFQGKLVRTSGAVDPSTRTLLAEIEVDNREGQLLPGSYTQVHLKVSNGRPALIVPTSAAVLSADGMHVAVVDSNQRVHLVKVTPGRDSGATIEIVAGLEEGQKIVGNPPDSLTDGEQVRVQPSTNRAAPARQEIQESQP
jgi:RND family efflux transporter MFP subunit